MEDEGGYSPYPRSEENSTNLSEFYSSEEDAEDVRYYQLGSSEEEGEERSAAAWRLERMHEEDLKRDEARRYGSWEMAEDEDEESFVTARRKDVERRVETAARRSALSPKLLSLMYSDLCSTPEATDVFLAEYRRKRVGEAALC